MSFLFWLLCLPFEAEVQNLESEKWQVRERAAHRLESRLPWCYPALLKPSKTPHGEKLKSRIRCSTWFGAKVSQWWGAADRGDLIARWCNDFWPLNFEEDGQQWIVQVVLTPNGISKVEIVPYFDGPFFWLRWR